MEKIHCAVIKAIPGVAICDSSIHVGTTVWFSLSYVLLSTVVLIQLKPVLQQTVFLYCDLIVYTYENHFRIFA